MTPSTDDEALLDRFDSMCRWLENSVHELPAGVLGGSNAATPEECAALMRSLEDFERLCAIFGSNSEDFVKQCRWHFEHYPLYLARFRQFSGYAGYIAAHNGPLKVSAKPDIPQDVAARLVAAFRARQSRRPIGPTS